MPRYKCLIFDLDGTLANTWEDIYRAWKYACGVLGLPEVSRDKVKLFIGPARDVYLPGLLGDNFREYGDRALALYSEHYSAHCTDTTLLYPGIREMVAALRGTYTLAAASNKPSPQVRLILAGLGIESLFKYVYGPDRVAKGKPAPDMFFAIAREEGVTPDQCLAVGDTLNDLKAGLAAGMDVAAVLWGYGEEKALREMNPAYMIGAPAELESCLRGMPGPDPASGFCATPGR